MPLANQSTLHTRLALITIHTRDKNREWEQKLTQIELSLAYYVQCSIELQSGTMRNYILLFVIIKVISKAVSKFNSRPLLPSHPL